MVEEYLQEIAQRCIDKIMESGRAVDYYGTLFLVCNPNIDAVVAGMRIEKSMKHMFLTAPFDAHAETIYRLARRNNV